MDMTEGNDPAEESDPGLVSIRNLYKIFGDDPASVLAYAQAGMSKAELLAEQPCPRLRDINVDMQAGEITVIMGPGPGKSTLIRHLNRLIEPTAGQILVDGDDVMTYGSLSCASCARRACRWCSRNRPPAAPHGRRERR
ncbi:MAG: ATP-binding cassette domain-containing protein [Geminicoccaceae bacterium]